MKSYTLRTNTVTHTELEFVIYFLFRYMCCGGFASSKNGEIVFLTGARSRRGQGRGEQFKQLGCLAKPSLAARGSSGGSGDHRGGGGGRGGSGGGDDQLSRQASENNDSTDDEGEFGSGRGGGGGGLVAGGGGRIHACAVLVSQLEKGKSFSCALYRGAFPVQGWLQVLPCGIMFRSIPLAGKRLTVRALFRDLVSVSRKSTFGGMVPNAVEIITVEETAEMARTGGWQRLEDEEKDTQQQAVVPRAGELQPHPQQQGKVETAQIEAGSTDSGSSSKNAGSADAVAPTTATAGTTGKKQGGRMFIGSFVRRNDCVRRRVMILSSVWREICVHTEK